LKSKKHFVFSQPQNNEQKTIILFEIKKHEIKVLFDWVGKGKTIKTE